MVAGGYATICSDLLDGVDVRLGPAVDRVMPERSSVRVVMADGRRMTADAVVVAVPLALMRAGVPGIESMPSQVRRSLRNLVTGMFEKVVLRYDEQWWGERSVYGVVGGGAPGAPAGSLAALRWTEFYSLTDVLGFPALVGFSGGVAARSRPRADVACVDEATAALRAAWAR